MHFVYIFSIDSQQSRTRWSPKIRTSEALRGYLGLTRYGNRVHAVRGTRFSASLWRVRGTRYDPEPRDAVRGTTQTVELRIPGIPDFRNSANPEFRIFGIPESLISEIPDFRNSGFPKFRISKIPDFRISGIPDFPNPDQTRDAVHHQHGRRGTRCKSGIPNAGRGTRYTASLA